MPATANPVPSYALPPRAAVRAIVAGINAGRPVLLRGQPGVGKTDLVSQVADLMGLKLIAMSAAYLDAVDLHGVPMVVDGRTVWARPYFLPTEPGHLIFVDEINRAPAMVQNTFLQLVQSGRVGEHVLPERCYIVGAANYESDGGGVQRSNSALLSRFAQVHVKPSVSDWRAWGAQNGIDPILLAFHEYREQNPNGPDGRPLPNVFHNFNPRADAFPCPRTWTILDAMLRGGLDAEIELPVAAGIVGEEAATEYLAYRRLHKNLTPTSVLLANPDTAPVPTEASAQYATAAALSARMTPRTIGAALRYLARLPQELAFFALKDAAARDKAVAETREFSEWNRANQDVLNA